MIPRDAIIEWQEKAPWSDLAQVEQDLVLTKAIIQISSSFGTSPAFALRGGTAMQKLFFNVPTRYSEDLDLVQIKNEPIGPAIDIIRNSLDPWLGNPKRDRKKDRFSLIYRFNSEIPPIRSMRLKIEVNNGEHFNVFGFQKKRLQCANSWFRGEAEITTYELEELLGTKLRALYQRKKGRDLFDLKMAVEHFPKLDPEKVIKCFQKYIAHEGGNVSRAQFEANLLNKVGQDSFTKDLSPLLTSESEILDFSKASQDIIQIFLALLPGEPWKGHEEHKDN